MEFPKAAIVELIFDDSPYDYNGSPIEQVVAPNVFPEFQSDDE